MSYQLKVIKDNPIGFWMLEESSGTVASDKSGCGNNGTYVGGISANMLPLVPGGVSGNKITNTSYITFPVTKNYYGQTASSALANKNTVDNSFTLEAWIYPSISSSSSIPLFADITNNIGLYWENSANIVFKISSSEKISYAVPYFKKALHVVGVYTATSISLYVDSILVGTKNISNFKFLNNTTLFQSGPTSSAEDFFIFDAPAVYRYQLNDSSIKKHYVEGSISKNPIQVVYPDEGILFSLNDMKIKPQFVYTYPKNRNWSEIIDGSTVYYDNINNYIAFYDIDLSGAKTFTYTDSFTIPTEIGLISSKIEWRNDYGITVRTSIDGTNWQPCSNGEAIPQYKKGSFDTSGKLFVEITMATPDITLFNPRLSFFAISLFSDKDIYSDNFGDKISSSTEYSLGSIDYPILSRNYSNGIRGNSFILSTSLQAKSLEMFYTPNGTAEFGLISGTGTGYSWNGSGVISKLNVDKIYVNGVDRTSATNISSWLVDGQPHHIVVVFATPITNNITFNHTSVNSHLYKNIAVYSKTLTASLVTEHYNCYVGKPSTSIQEPVMTMTELTPKYYNNDWVVIQTI